VKRRNFLLGAAAAIVVSPLAAAGTNSQSPGGYGRPIPLNYAVAGVSGKVIWASELGSGQRRAMSAREISTLFELTEGGGVAFCLIDPGE
jgi:hypothetical protein